MMIDGLDDSSLIYCINKRKRNAMIYGELRQIFIGVVLLVFGVLWGICQTGDLVETGSEATLSPVLLDSVMVEGYQGKRLSSLCTSG